jgi:hypothetical protein
MCEYFWNTCSECEQSKLLKNGATLKMCSVQEKKQHEEMTINILVTDTKQKITDLAFDNNGILRRLNHKKSGIVILCAVLNFIKLCCFICTKP